MGVLLSYLTHIGHCLKMKTVVPPEHWQFQAASIFVSIRFSDIPAIPWQIEPCWRPTPSSILAGTEPNNPWETGPQEAWKSNMYQWKTYFGNLGPIHLLVHTLNSSYRVLNLMFKLSRYMMHSIRPSPPPSIHPLPQPQKRKKRKKQTNKQKRKSTCFVLFIF